MKKFLFITDNSSPNGYVVIHCHNIQQATTAMFLAGFLECVYNSGALILEDYGGMWIVDQAGTIVVFDPKLNQRFIVCLDEGKRGYRRFDWGQNNVVSARFFIDGLK